MSLEEPQSHKMPQREGKEARREKRKNCNIKLPIRNCIKRKAAKKENQIVPSFASEIFFSLMQKRMGQKLRPWLAEAKGVSGFKFFCHKFNSN